MGWESCESTLRNSNFRESKLNTPLNQACPTRNATSALKMRDHTRNLLMNATMDDGSTAGDDALAAGVAWITQTHYDLDTMWLL